jgi:hypothetical protein
MTTHPTQPTYVVFLVRAISHAMKGEAALTKAGIAHKLIPVPRALGSDCGVCVRVDPADRERAEKALRAAGVEVTAIHELRQPQRTKEAADGHAAAD